MIDLAPHHKAGLVVANPILLAGGVIGYGEAVHPGIDLAVLGAVVVGPIVLDSRAGAGPPRLAETNGGFVLDTGLQNRGLSASLAKFARLWPRLGCPVIMQLADRQPRQLAQVAEQLTTVVGLAGLELLLPRQADVVLTSALVRTVARITDLPLWVKLPLPQAALLAPAAIEAGAAGLVVGQPPVGALPYGRETEQFSVVTGALYGPLVFASMLQALTAVARLNLPGALVACGGLHTREQITQALAVAQAVQLDSVAWVEPGWPQRLARWQVAGGK